MKFKKSLIALFSIILLLTFCYAQLDNTQKQIEDAAKNLERNVSQARSFTEQDQWFFKGAQWKELFLKVPAIAAMDAFFTKINPFFLIFLGMDWKFSLEFLFALMFWCVTFFGITKYMSNFNDDGFLAILYSILISVLLAQINLFEYVGKWTFALIFYKDSILWRTLFFGIFIVLFFLWGKVHDWIAKKLKKNKENKEKKEGKEAINTLGQIVGAAVDPKTTPK